MVMKLAFPVILILVSQRAEDLLFELFGTESLRQMVIEKAEKQRGNVPTLLEYVVFIYVMGVYSVSRVQKPPTPLFLQVLFMRKHTKFMSKACNRT